MGSLPLLVSKASVSLLTKAKTTERHMILSSSQSDRLQLKLMVAWVKRVNLLLTRVVELSMPAEGYNHAIHHISVDLQQHYRLSTSLEKLSSNVLSRPTWGSKSVRDAAALVPVENVFFKKKKKKKKKKEKKSHSLAATHFLSLSSCIS
ncbi:uncharacterized protein V6R79_014904 [Siganus canaliculatus]